MHELIESKRGEALQRLAKVDPEHAAQVPDSPVSLRGIRAHEHATVDEALVRQVLIERLPGLTDVLRRLRKAEPSS